ncbi:MAG: helix-turn-helix domain-containing protein [Bacteroidota bacterium]|nr:helix-turn-helix domain-containing protein [Bacteroidota bacterium]
MRKQRSPAAFGFDRYDKRRLQKALKEVSDRRTFLRLKAVLLTVQGMNIQSVAKLLDKTPRAIYYWVRTYLENHSPSDLFEAPRSGRPVAAPKITDKRILLELKQNPLHLGYHTTVWTVALLAEHLNTCYDSNISARTLRRRMKAIGLRFKRPRYVYSEKDPNRTQKKGASCES